MPDRICYAFLLFGCDLRKSNRQLINLIQLMFSCAVFSKPDRLS